MVVNNSVFIERPLIYNDYILVVPKVVVKYRFDCICCENFIPIKISAPKISAKTLVASWIAIFVILKLALCQEQVDDLVCFLHGNSVL